MFPISKSTQAWLNGLLGVGIFAGSLPATKLAIISFDPAFLTFARASIAGILAVLLLLLFKQQLPKTHDIKQLVIISIGVVIGFPLFTALALQYIDTAHSILFVGILPLVTAICGILLGEQKPQRLFWLFALIGSALVTGFSLTLSNVPNSLLGNIYMLLAIFSCGIAYAYGGKLSRTLGGWQVICWALVIALPFMLILCFFNFSQQHFEHMQPPAIYGLAYVSIFSMLIGFIFWYKGLAQGGVVAVGQLQLLQPFLGLLLCFFILNEDVSYSMIMGCILVCACVFFARKYA